MSVPTALARKRIACSLRSLNSSRRAYQTQSAADRNVVRIVEVGPRDGLQNEKGIVPTNMKVELINRLGIAGLTIIEAGSFVSPKWVPQVSRSILRWWTTFSTSAVRVKRARHLSMLSGAVYIQQLKRRLKREASGKVNNEYCADTPRIMQQMAGTAEVITRMEKLPGVHYPVLVPNMKGLDNLLELLSTTTSQSVDSSSAPTSTIPPTDEIAIFTAATDAFCLANTNCTIEESLKRLAPVTQKAREKGLRVRGYVSVVITCPYSGKVDYHRVRDVAKELLEMGCYEVSLGDTTGTGNSTTVGDMLDVVVGVVPVEKLAGHFHDTFGMGVANALTALETGVRTLDSSVGGLGGCPYSPGATGNVATEDILYSIQNSKYRTEKKVDLEQLADIGWWISEKLNRQNASLVGRALRARKERQKSEKD